MFKNLTSAGLFSLFSWNVLFGSFGGALDCLHADYSYSAHMGSGGRGQERCIGTCQPLKSPDLLAAEECARCVDVEFKGTDSPLVRTARPFSLDAPTPPLLTPESRPSDSVLPRKAVPVTIRSRAPPIVAGFSVIVAQCTVLRL